jgi:hypothetical protein
MHGPQAYTGAWVPATAVSGLTVGQVEDDGKETAQGR